MGLRVFICTDHEGHYPVGVCSIVVAETELKAKNLLKKELTKSGLNGKDFTLREIDTTKPFVEILLNGDY